MPPDREKPNKRKSLSFAKKRELCEWKRDNPSYNQEELAERFDISKPQVCKILKAKDKWLSIDVTNKDLKIKNGIEVPSFQK